MNLKFATPHPAHFVRRPLPMGEVKRGFVERPGFRVSILMLRDPGLAADVAPLFDLG
jgi:hypothetical protein